MMNVRHVDGRAVIELDGVPIKQVIDALQDLNCRDMPGVEQLVTGTIRTQIEVSPALLQELAELLAPRIASLLVPARKTYEDPWDTEPTIDGADEVTLDMSNVVEGFVAPRRGKPPTYVCDEHGADRAGKESHLARFHPADRWTFTTDIISPMVPPEVPIPPLLEAAHRFHELINDADNLPTPRAVIPYIPPPQATIDPPAPEPAESPSPPVVADPNPAEVSVEHDGDDTPTSVKLPEAIQVVGPVERPTSKGSGRTDVGDEDEELADVDPSFNSRRRRGAQLAPPAAPTPRRRGTPGDASHERDQRAEWCIKFRTCPLCAKADIRRSFASEGKLSAHIQEDHADQLAFDGRYVCSCGHAARRPGLIAQHTAAIKPLASKSRHKLISQPPAVFARPLS